MAISRLSLPSALCLATLLLTPIAAHKKPPVTVYTTVTDCGPSPTTITLPTITPPTDTPPLTCLTATSTTTPATCDPTHTCSNIPCPAIAMVATQPCGCPAEVPTVYVPTPTCCPGCIVPTFITTATDCPTAPPPPPCAVVTTRAPPACPSISGCAVPDCIYLETLTLGCDCSGVATVTECDGKCPGCLTQYETLHVPCPTTVTHTKG